MKKRAGVLLTIVLVFAFSFFAFNDYVNFDTVSAVLFMIIILFLIIKNKKNLDFQKMVGIGKIPIIYAILWKTSFGLKFMDKVSEKYRELIKLIGYSFIGFGFVGMIFISINILMMLFSLFISPKEASENVALVLPLTNIPGMGYLSFWHFLITIFLTVLVHEFAHGIVARAHKIPVKSSGLGIFSIILPIFPLAFVEPDEKKLEKEKDVVQYSIFAAGPMINIFFALIIALLASFVLTPIEDSITHPVGFSFGGVMQGYPAQDAGMSPGDIINEVNGIEVLSYQGFSEEFPSIKPGEELKIRTDKGMFTLVTKPSPEDETRGYIGITNIANEKRINTEFENIGGAFFWFKGLIKWLYMLNIIIGLMNLLPLMITDGGRMLKTALEKIMKDTKKADKAWIFIGTIFIFTLLFALFVKYSLQFFSFIGLG